MKNIAWRTQGFSGDILAATTEEGQWISYIQYNTRISETLYAHAWLIRHNGLIFISHYYDNKPTVPDTS